MSDLDAIEKQADALEPGWGSSVLALVADVRAARAEAAALREALDGCNSGCECPVRDSDGDGVWSLPTEVDCGECGGCRVAAALSQPGPGAALLERVKKLEALRHAVKAMRANLFEREDALGGKHTDWFTVAPCEYGEAVDEALAALDAPAAYDGDGDAD